MKTHVGLVTTIAFWEIGNGQNARIQALYQFLSQHVRLTLYYLGDETCPLPSPPFLDSDKEAQLADYLKNAQHDVILVERLYLDWILQLGIPKARFYLDAHDLLSQRRGSPLSIEEEMTRFSQFDRIILLQQDEVNEAISYLGKDRVLLCPHPVVVQAPKRYHRKSIRSIGFFGGPSRFNIEGIQWFHDEVLPLLGSISEKCIVHGAINYAPFSIFTPNLVKGEILPTITEFYQQVDIAFNPVLSGTGLKIKTVEALAYGVPLVTTRYGAQGLSEQKGLSFLMADSPQDFADSILQLVSSQSLRIELATSSRAYSKRHLTPEACFKPLLTSFEDTIA